MRVVDREPVHLVLCDDIMFVRPQCSPFAQPTGRWALAGPEPGAHFPRVASPRLSRSLTACPFRGISYWKGVWSLTIRMVSTNESGVRPVPRHRDGIVDHPWRPQSR